MMFIGVGAIGTGIVTAQKIKLLRYSIQEEQQLRNLWNQHDIDGNGYLDIKELTRFVRDANVDMNKNEVASLFMALGEYLAWHSL